MLCLLGVFKCAARDADLRLSSGSALGHNAFVGAAFGVVDKTEENEERRSERAARRRLCPASLARAIGWMAESALLGVLRLRAEARRALEGVLRDDSEIGDAGDNEDSRRGPTSRGCLG